MLANCCNSEEVEMTAPYLGGSSWVPTGTFKHDWNNEEGWTLLPGPAGFGSAADGGYECHIQ